MHKLAPQLLRMMGGAYPELIQAKTLIEETLRIEEERFKVTLGKGLKLLEEEVEKLKPDAALPGDVAFKLYDTFGFPLDLTQDVLKSQKRAVDTAGFDTAMKKQKDDARKAWAGSGEAADDRIWFDIKEKVGGTEFLGYDTDHASGRILAIVQNGAAVDAAKPGESFIVVNQTPFYAESGGQVGDTGAMKTESGVKFVVLDTKKKLGDLFVHQVKLSAPVKIGDAVDMQVDVARRAAIKAHHSATHLMHEALRRKLGTHVGQKGSLNAPDRLRFDISHNKPMTDEEIAHVESEVNTHIRKNTPVFTRLLPKDEAVALGAMAMFGEKYGDMVRVVGMGGAEIGEKEYSLELCGGTHVARTGDIGFFRIVSESAVSAGVRRIEALAGEAALNFARGQAKLLQDIGAHLKSPEQDLPARIAQLVEEKKKLERDLAEARKQMAADGSQSEKPEDVGGIKFISKNLDGVPARDLKSIADNLKQKLGRESGLVVLTSIEDGKASLVVSATQSAITSLSSVDLVKVGTRILGGTGGGGRADMAQGGGPEITKIPEAIAAIKKDIMSKKE